MTHPHSSYLCSQKIFLLCFLILLLSSYALSPPAATQHAPGASTPHQVLRCFPSSSFSCTENQFCFLFIQSHTTFQPYQHQYKILTLINMLHTSQVNMSVNNNNNHTHMVIQLASRSKMINNAPLQSNNQSRGQWSGFAPFHRWKIVFYV